MANWNVHDEKGGFLGCIRVADGRKDLALAKARAKFPKMGFVIELISFKRRGFYRGKDGVWRYPERRNRVQRDKGAIV